MSFNTSTPYPEMKTYLFFISFILISLSAMSESVPATFDITKYGAVGDGKTLNTNAIQKTIDECSKQGGGTESFGDFENISFRNCKVDSTKGIKIYSVDGARLKNLTISDIDIKEATVAIMIRLGARLKTFREGDVKKPIGSLENVNFKRITVKHASQIALLISGIPGNDIKNINISDLKVRVTGGGKAADAKTILAENIADYPEVNMFGKIMPTYGMYIRHAKKINLDHIQLTTETGDERPAFIYIDTAKIKH